MGSQEDLDDDDFRDLYKEYTGPVVSNANNTQNSTATNKRPAAGSDEEQGQPDPYAVPTDFTSREAKVWEAKSKAIERNWKKRKEEELICKICGESGHFTQGCPSTLGANRKSQDFFERVPARESHVKALFTEKVVSQIEKDTGSKIKIEEKFIIVSGKDRLILRKGVDAVHKVKEEGGNKGPSSQISRSRSPERRSPVNSRPRRSDSQRSNPIPHNASQFQHRYDRHEKAVECTDSQRSNPSPHHATQFQHRYDRHEKAVEDRVRDDLQNLSRGSPQAYGNGGARGRSSKSRSPGRPSYMSNTYNSYDGHGYGRRTDRTDGWSADRMRSEVQTGQKFEYVAFPQTLEELEFEYKREAVGLATDRDKEEDEENNKHREAIRELRENYLKKLAVLRETHARKWEEFLQVDAQRRHQQAHQHISASQIGGYKPPNYLEYENSTSSHQYPGTNFPLESRGRYPNLGERYPSPLPRETYGDFPRERRDDFGKAYNRF